NNTWGGGIVMNDALTLDVAAGSTLTVNGVISAQGQGGVAKTGPGTAVLTAINTHSMPTIVREGILRATRAEAFSSNINLNQPVSVLDGATLELQDVKDVPVRLHLEGRGVGNLGAVRNTLGISIWAGNVELVGTPFVAADAGTTLEFTGVLEGPTNDGFTK